MEVDKKVEQKAYVFWLFDWGYHPIPSTMHLVPYYRRCDITKEEITIHDERGTFVFRLEDIQEYGEHTVYEGATTNLWILVRGKSLCTIGKSKQKQQKIFLVPADALKHQRLYRELHNMYEVIHCYKNGEEPTLEKNPYYRMLVRHGQAHRLTEQTWDPTLHPSRYSPVPTVMGILTNLVLGVTGVTVIGAVVIGIAYYIITTFF